MIERTIHPHAVETRPVREGSKPEGPRQFEGGSYGNPPRAGSVHESPTPTAGRGHARLAGGVTGDTLLD